MSQSLLDLKRFRYQKKSSNASDGGTQESVATDHTGSSLASPVIGRRRVSSAHSEPDSPVMKQRASARRCLLSDSEEEASVVEISDSEDSNDPTNPNNIERNLAFMREAFPDQDPMELQDCLAGHGWQLELAMEVMAAQVAAAQARAAKPPAKRRRLMVVNSDSSGDESGPPATNGAQNGAAAATQKKKPPSKRQRAQNGDEPVTIGDSDDDEDFEDKCLVYMSDSGGEDEDDEEGGGSRRLGDSAQLQADRDLVVQYLNSSTTEELLCMAGCSRKKADIIIQCRPYPDWEKALSTFLNVKGISPYMLNAALRVLRMRGLLDKLLRRCESISDKLKARVTLLIQGGGDQDKITEQPANLNQTMRLSGYQMIGLSWLILMFKEGLNAVLADEMGLGKTIQAVSFLAHLQLQNPAWKYLVVVPSSTLDNWARELSTWCPSLDVVEYRGSLDVRRDTRLEIHNGNIIWDVVLTTYNTVASTPEDKAFFKAHNFKYIVFDEAHMLKNMSSKRYSNLMKLKGQHRLLLTGTPLQNNLVELMSLLVFVMPQMFGRVRRSLQTLFEVIPKSMSPDTSRPAYEASRINEAKRIMSPFFLRRLKRDVLKDLPAKQERVMRLPMVPSQATRYKQLKDRYVKEAKDKLRGGSTSDHESAVGMMMSMRKLANHPLLLRHHYTDDKLRQISRIFAGLPEHEHKEEALVFEDLTYLSDFEVHQTCNLYPRLRQFLLPDSVLEESGKLAALDELLPRLRAEGSRVLLFSQFVIMLDVLESYVKLRGYRYCRLDGQTAVTDRIDLIDKYNNDDDIFVFLLSTRAGGLGINLTSANVVILHDIDFNPHNDRQAEDRCHRIGQTREVQVIRLICQNSIDECMLQVGQDKLSLDRDISGADGKECATEDARDVRHLLALALESGDG